MDWSILTLDNFHFLKDCVLFSDLEGSDTSLVNIFLLQKKYDIKTAIQDGFLFRYYSGNDNRSGYGFPVKLCPITLPESFPVEEHSLKHAVSLIIQDAKNNNRKVKFCLFDEKQKNEVSSVFESEFPDIKLNWQTNRDDCDYIYEREKLANLQGKTYHKKKNHVSRFLRTYEGKWEFRSLNLCNIAEDMIFVAEKWLEERKNSVEMTDEEIRILDLEHEMIKTALKNKEDFSLEGGVLYTEGKPVAMTLASKISESILDVHFEKCLSESAANGAYAAINWCFANSCEAYKLLNREEDMGVEGLRKAKLSYHPDNLLEKFYSC